MISNDSSLFDLNTAPWLDEAQSKYSARAVEDLQVFNEAVPDVAAKLGKMAWFRESTTQENADAIRHLTRLSKKAPGLAISISDMPRFRDGPTGVAPSVILTLSMLVS